MSLFAFLPCLRQKLTRLCLQNRFACETYAQLLEYLSVHFAQHNRAMNLAAAQLRQLFQCLAAVLIVLREHRERHEHLVGMQTRVVTAKIIGLGILYRLDHRLRNELCCMVDSSKMLRYVKQKGSATAQQRT